MSSSFDAMTALAAFGILCPFAPLGAALMTTVASFTKTYREAQTYLTFILLIPTLPLMFAALLNVEAELMRRDFPEFHVKKELYWPKGKDGGAPGTALPAES